MKIELHYDPVRPETRVRIDGQPVERTDIYGFLYPVRNYLLQTWLRTSGSWRGLAWQLQELSRGEAVELDFFGRAEDFEDVLAALPQTRAIRMRFHQEDPLSGYASLFAQVEEQLDKLLDVHAGNGEKKTLSDIYPDVVDTIRSLRAEPEEPWLCDIRSDEDYRAADRQTMCCCVVRGEYLDSYEKLDGLRMLTRSMRRSQDMICCCLEDPDRWVDFAHYAAQYELGFRFAEYREGLAALQRKYGSAHVLRSRYAAYARIAQVLRQCYDRYDAVKSQRSALAKIQKPTAQQIRELAWCKSVLNWFDRKKPYLTRINELLAAGPQLREQKEE